MKTRGRNSINFDIKKENDIIHVPQGSLRKRKNNKRQRLWIASRKLFQIPEDRCTYGWMHSNFDSMHRTLTSLSQTKFRHEERLDGYELPSLAEVLLVFNSCKERESVFLVL